MSCDFKDTQQTLFCNTIIEMVRGLSNEKFHPERQQEELIWNWFLSGNVKDLIQGRSI